MKLKLAPSILSADFSKLGEEIKAVEPYADYLHVDVMDGHFVPNISIGVPVVESLKDFTELPLDVHLMISEPEKFVEKFAGAGADIITIHAEIFRNPEAMEKIIEHIKLHAKAGVSINPATPLSRIEKVLDKVDLVLIMSVNPGFGGQGFIESAVQKLKNLKKIKMQKKSNFEIEIDGGIGLQNLQKVLDAGAEVVVSGSAIFHSENPAETAKKMRAILDLAEK